MHKKSGTVDIAGFELTYVIEGAGFPALVIGSAIYYPRVFSPELTKHLQLIFIDHRGFVNPPSRVLSNADFDLDILIADVEIIRKHLKLEKFIVIGHSGHAFMALEYAKKFPEHVRGVVLIGVTPDYSNATHEAADKFFDQDATGERKQLFFENMKQLPEQIAKNPDSRFVAFCLAAGPKSWYNYSYDASSLWKGIVTNMQAIDHMWGVVFRDIDITKGLEKFDKPVFLAIGKYDYLTGPSFLWNTIKAFFRKITITVFEKSAHCPPYEEAELFNARLLAWIKNEVTAEDATAGN